MKPDNEIIKQQEPPVGEYSIVLHNGILNSDVGTLATEVRFLASSDAGINNGYPTNGDYVQGETLTLSTGVNGTNALVSQEDIITVRGQYIGQFGQFLGWFADAARTQQLGLNNTLQFIVGQKNTHYEGNQNNTIHLYAKATGGV